MQASLPEQLVGTPEKAKTPSLEDALQRLSLLEKDVVDLQRAAGILKTEGFEPVDVTVESVSVVPGRGLVAAVAFLTKEKGRIYPHDVMKGSEGGEWRVIGIEMFQGATRSRTLGLVLVELQPGALGQGTTLSKVAGRRD